MDQRIRQVDIFKANKWTIISHSLDIIQFEKAIKAKTLSQDRNINIMKNAYDDVCDGGIK